MLKIYSIVHLFILTLYPFTQLYASPQLPDYIIFKGDTIATYNLILEQYLQKQALVPSEKLFGLNFRSNDSGEFSFNCWRGYQALYEIDNDSIFLVAITRCHEFNDHKIDKAASTQRLKALFSEKALNNKVFISWFSGNISFPLNMTTIRWDGVFYRIYEKEKVFNISNGKVLNKGDVVNYINDPRRINRRDKNKISDILFKKIKKAKWKNQKNYDCSDKYLITINEDGHVSKVRMIYTDEEIEEFYDEDEYNFCIENIRNALKNLRFDIIKDKGKPISEDIYLQIWIEDNGKIENWTD